MDCFVLPSYMDGCCPYSNFMLSSLPRNLSEIKSSRANLLAFNLEIPDSSFSMKEKLDLEFEVLCD